MHQHTSPNDQKSSYEEYEHATSIRFYRWLSRFFPWPFHWLLTPIALLLLLAHLLRLFFFPEDPDFPPLLHLSRRGQEIFVILLLLTMFTGFAYLIYPWLFK
jgi:hypothetical protein